MQFYIKKITLFIFILPIYHLANCQNNNFDYKKNDTTIIVDKTSKDTILSNEDAERVFIDVQIKPEFPGGISGWIKYLERNINRDLPYKNGAPPGRYTVSLSFIVAKDGTISDIKAESDPGYGSKEEAIRLMARSPKWKPAVQNGKNVIYRQKQSITFMVN